MWNPEGGKSDDKTRSAKAGKRSCSSGVQTVNGDCCVLPFRYLGLSYQLCTSINNGNTPWCATTSNYDTDGHWGNCKAPQYKTDVEQKIAHLRADFHPQLNCKSKLYIYLGFYCSAKQLSAHNLTAVKLYVDNDSRSINDHLAVETDCTKVQYGNETCGITKLNDSISQITCNLGRQPFPRKASLVRIPKDPTHSKLPVVFDIYPQNCTEEKVNNTSDLPNTTPRQPTDYTEEKVNNTGEPPTNTDNAPSQTTDLPAVVLPSVLVLLILILIVTEIIVIILCKKKPGNIRRVFELIKPVNYKGKDKGTPV